MTPESGHGSFDMRISFQNFVSEPSMHQPLSAPMDMMDALALEAPPCGSPMSTTSSLSHPESVPTPPFTGLSMYDTLEPAFHHVRDTPANYPACPNDPEPLWQSNYPDPATWDSRAFVMPCQSIPNYGQHSLQMAPSFPTQAQVSAPTPHAIYNTSPQYPTVQTINSEDLKEGSSGSTEDDSDELTDWDSDDSDSDDSPNDNWSTVGTTGGRLKRGGFFRVEGWSRPSCNSPVRSEMGKFTCPHSIKPRNTPCPVRFGRPEHLRRHIKTVHGIGQGKLHVCKVPKCHRPFPRSDNLRQHYFIHLKKPKRKSNNPKLTWPEMKEILNSKKDRSLRRWLKMKLKQEEEAQLGLRMK